MAPVQVKGPHLNSPPMTASPPPADSPRPGAFEDSSRSRASADSTALLVVTAAAPRDGWPVAELASVPMARPFQAGEGSTWEGIPPDGAGVVAALRTLLRAGAGHVGIGCGDAEPAGPGRGVPGDAGGRAAPGVRAVRAPAYAAARVALAAAHRTHQGVALRASRGRGRTGPPPKDVEDAETCLWLLADLWHRRSVEGWAVADHMDAGLTGRECALRLDISPSAVSQRATAARYVEGRRAADLAGRLLDRLVRHDQHT